MEGGIRISVKVMLGLESSICPQCLSKLIDLLISHIQGKEVK
jgi:hypothetical protein